MEQKKSTISYTLGQDEIDALETGMQNDPIALLSLSRNKIMRYAILMFGKRNQPENIPATKADIAELKALIEVGLARPAPKEKASDTPKPPRTSGYKSVKQSEEEKLEAGRALCSSLGGTLVGNSCRYTKYEVIASGRAVDYTLTEPLQLLSQETLDKQYDPSKLEWDLAKSEEQAG